MSRQRPTLIAADLLPWAIKAQAWALNSTIRTNWQPFNSIWVFRLQICHTSTTYYGGWFTAVPCHSTARITLLGFLLWPWNHRSQPWVHYFKQPFVGSLVFSTSSLTDPRMSCDNSIRPVFQIFNFHSGTKTWGLWMWQGPILQY